MNVRIGVLALAAVAVLGACGEDGKTKSGGTVEPAATSSSTAPTTATTAATSSTTSAPSTTATTAKATTTTAKPTTTTTTAASVSYANCTAVRDAGKAPLYRGDPGYSSKLDRDGDGIACE